MTAQRKRRYRAALGLLCFTVLGAPLATRLLGPRLPRFPYAQGQLTPADEKALLSHAGWQLGELPVASGVVLRSLVRKPQNPRAPWIVYFSGNDATPLQVAQRFLEHVAGERDWGLMSWGYRGTAGAGGPPEREALFHDAERMVEQLMAREKLSADRVHLVAFSLGGFLAAHVVQTASQKQVKFASLSLLASGAHIEMMHPGLYERIFGGDEYEIAPMLGAVPSPALVVQGAADTTVDVSQGRGIAQKLGSRARYVEVPGVGHNDLLETEATFAAVRSMVEKPGAQH